MHSPDCYSILSAKAVKYPFDTKIVQDCTVCDGIWVAGATLKQLLTSEPRAPSYEKFIKAPKQENCRSDTKSCPSCVNQKLNILKMRGIEIDYCESCHGVF